MKIIILFLTLLIVFAESIDQATDIEELLAPRDPCRFRQNCNIIRPCQPGTVLNKNRLGCCCTTYCPGPNVALTCECADRVCNVPSVICKQCFYGCYCKVGFARDPVTWKCIPEVMCPLSEDGMIP